MTTHIMLDLETIGKRPGCVVLAAAFVRISDEAHCTLNLSIPDQEALGLEKDPDTMAWWNDQEAKHPGAWAAATTNPTPLATALPYFLEWIRWAIATNPSRTAASRDGDFLLWCHGATFDAPISPAPGPNSSGGSNAPERSSTCPVSTRKSTPSRRRTSRSMTRSDRRALPWRQ